MNNNTERLNAELQKELIVLRPCNSNVIGMHSHPFFEFVYVLRGKAEHTINDHTMLLSEGDYFLIDLNCKHEYRKLSGESEFCIVNCLFIPRFIDETLKNSKSFDEIMRHCMPGFGNRHPTYAGTLVSYHDQDGFIGALIQKMLKENQEKKSGYFEVLRHSLISMLVCLARNELHTSDTGSEYMTRYIKEFVSKNYMQPLHLSDICDKLNFSLTHASLTFKRETDMTFRDYLIKVRLEKACHMLRVTDKTVAEISGLVGYSDPAFFFKIFKKELGVTPYQYRIFHKNRI